MPTKKIAIDKKVPAFSSPATGESPWKLSGAKGRKLVIYFYPRDNTSGCTKEGQAFRDLYPKFRRAKTEIVGVSPDTLASHEKFQAKQEFPFELLSDVYNDCC